MPNKALYISYDGMTDPLGQSQVLPYLKGLAALGHQIHLISFEKEERLDQQEKLRTIIKEAGLIWHPQSYTKRPPILSTLKDVWVLKRTIKKLHLQHGFDFTHCRSYIAALGGLWAKKQFDLPFIFDMRGFWADERVDGKIWNPKKWPFSWVYKFFKQKEQAFLKEATKTISLTHNAKKEIESWSEAKSYAPIQVVPCCVDLDHFIPQDIKSKKEYTLGYLGSVGTWYMLEEMLDFYKVLLEIKPKAKFQWLTKESPDLIFNQAKAKGLPLDQIEVRSAERVELPGLLSQWDASVFFILPAYSKKASSPVKQGELMAMGIPVFANSGVGDTDHVISTYQSGVLIHTFDDISYRQAIKTGENKNFNATVIRKGAQDFYGLQEGIERLNKVYCNIEK